MLCVIPIHQIENLDTLITLVFLDFYLNMFLTEVRCVRALKIRWSKGFYKVHVIFSK